ncbi:MAG: hypothetical protein AB7J32_15655 [Pseudonocardia sp.]
MTGFQDSIKSEFAQLDLREVLQSSPEVLLGVSADAAALLRDLRLVRIFDLAMSGPFRTAAGVREAAQQPDSVVGRFGRLPSDVVDDAHRDTPPHDLLDAGPHVLATIGAATATRLREVLGISTVRELALWPPFVTARRLVDEALGATVPADEEAPPELVPRFGGHATDRVFYRSVVLIDAPGKAELDLGSSGPVDLTATSPGFTAPAQGAVLTYSQSWYPVAVTLGNLLYSLPLAPGESTRIAVIDYTRRTRSGSEEEIAQTEDLSNTLVQSRSISEVAQAVATELQSGASESTTSSHTESIGLAAGGFVSPVLFGGAAGASRTASTATSFTTSKGERDLSAKNQQKISSSTQQSAFVQRNRKAAVVTEASQEERESLSTRSVTNYNHMHALSVQYYEVVQVYRTEVRTERAERALFVPMQQLTFDEAMIARYRGALFRAALSDRVRQLLVTAAGSVAASLELRPAYRFVD